MILDRSPPTPIPHTLRLHLACEVLLPHPTRAGRCNSPQPPCRRWTRATAYRYGLHMIHMRTTAAAWQENPRELFEEAESSYV